jgi:hypothetical protein
MYPPVGAAEGCDLWILPLLNQAKKTATAGTVAAKSEIKIESFVGAV